MAKKVALYGVMSAVCLVLGYVETLLPLDFIAPGIKIGLANALALLFILQKDIKGAFVVNIIRILLTNLLFINPFALIFSLSAGLVSTFVMWIVSKCEKFSAIGYSVLGALTHNLVQTVIAFLIFGSGVIYYFPILIICAVISGTIIGFLAKILHKKIKPLF